MRRRPARRGWMRRCSSRSTSRSATGCCSAMRRCAARDFATRHLDDCAMLRVLGQSQRSIALQYLIEFVCVGALASAAGVALGFAVHHGFVWLLAGLVEASLPPPTVWPALFGIGVG